MQSNRISQLYHLLNALFFMNNTKIATMDAATIVLIIIIVRKLLTKILQLKANATKSYYILNSLSGIEERLM